MLADVAVVQSARGSVVLEFHAEQVQGLGGRSSKIVLVDAGEPAADVVAVVHLLQGFLAQALIVEFAQLVVVQLGQALFRALIHLLVGARYPSGVVIGAARLHKARLGPHRFGILVARLRVKQLAGKVVVARGNVLAPPAAALGVVLADGLDENYLNKFICSSINFNVSSFDKSALINLKSFINCVFDLTLGVSCISMSFFPKVATK